MRVIKNKITSEQLLQLVTSNQWASVKEISQIGACGLNKAQIIKKEIIASIKEKTGKDCPAGVVPMEYVIDYFNINLKFLRKQVRE